MKTLSTILLFLFQFLLVVSCTEDELSKKTDNNIFPESEISLAGFLSEPSGIAYRSKSNSLFIVADNEAKIYEIDLSGSLIRIINVSGNDFEGITFSLSEDTIIIAEETGNKISSYVFSGVKVNSFEVNASTIEGNGLEGIALDNKGNLYAVVEKFPRLLLKIFNQTEVFRKEIIIANDLSDIYYDNIEDCLWIISDESKKIIKLSKDGTFLNEWIIPFDKGEGITFAQNKMYIVNDGNSKLYVFDKPE